MARKDTGVVPPESFFQFLDRMMRRRGWTDYRLTHEAKLKSTSYLSQLRKGKKIGYGVAAALADAFGIPRAVMYIMAGLDHAPPGLRSVLEAWEDFPDEDIADMARKAERALEKRRADDARAGLAKPDRKRKA